MVSRMFGGVAGLGVTFGESCGVRRADRFSQLHAPSTSCRIAVPLPSAVLGGDGDTRAGVHADPDSDAAAYPRADAATERCGHGQRHRPRRASGDFR